MGWIFSIGLFLAYVLSDGNEHINADTILIASAIFAVAGAISTISNRIWVSKNISDK